MRFESARADRAGKILRTMSLAAAICAGAALASPMIAGSALAASQRIIVVVNDQPITNRDVSQRVKLNSALGDSRGSSKQRKKRALNTLINEVVARAEAKKRGVKINDKRINDAIERMAKGSNTSVAGLTKTLKQKGVSMSTLRAQVEATLYLRWIIGQKQKSKVEVTEAEVDRRYNKITSDPRLKPVTVYQIREVDLPVGNVSQANAQQLLYARAIEAQQIAKKYRGCNTLKSASKGIFNVKINRMVQAPADKMPKDMRKVLNEAGTKKLIGPMRVPTGIRMIAFCGKRTLKPPKPPREAIKNMLLNEKYDKVADRVMRDLRRRAFIEYTDKSAVLTQ